MDEATLQFYRGNAEAYAEREITSRQARLTAFLAPLPPGACILELGCGAGGDTAEMLARGFDVRATDGSPEMAAVASRRIKRPVATLLFHELDEVEAYEGVWANACLLSAGNWSSLEIETGEVIGFDNQWATMLFVVARKSR